jgi:hypothetical protein
MRGGDEAHASAALDPHLTIGVEAGAPRATSAPAQEHAECVGVSVSVAGPVPDAGVDDVELEGEDVLKDVRARRGRVERAERAVEVRRFG